MQIFNSAGKFTYNDLRICPIPCGKWAGILKGFVPVGSAAQTRKLPCLVPRCLGNRWEQHGIKKKMETDTDTCVYHVCPAISGNTKTYSRLHVLVLFFAFGRCSIGLQNSDSIVYVSAHTRVWRSPWYVWCLHLCKGEWMKLTHCKDKILQWVEHFIGGTLCGKKMCFLVHKWVRNRSIWGPIDNTLWKTSLPLSRTLLFFPHPTNLLSWIRLEKGDLPFLWWNPLSQPYSMYVRLQPKYDCVDVQHTSSTAQGGGGSFKDRKPIGEVGCCESRMAERSHWWTDWWLRSLLFFSLSFFLWLSTYLPTYLSMYPCIYLPIYLSI